MSRRKNKKSAPAPKAEKKDIILYPDNKKSSAPLAKGNTYTYSSKVGKKKRKTKAIESGASISKGKGFYYNVIEIPKGASICAHYDSTTSIFDIEEQEGAEELSRSDYITIEANLNSDDMIIYKSFRKLANFLGRGLVDFTVFAEFITFENQKIAYLNKDSSPRLIVTDIYINDNWIRHKELIEYCEPFGIKVMPILYEGLHDDAIFNTYANNVSSTINPEIKNYGVVIKSIFEDEDNLSRRCVFTRYGSDHYTLPKDTDKEGIRADVDLFVGTNITETRLKMVDTMVSYAYPNFLTSPDKYDPKNILRYAVDYIKKTYLPNAMLMVGAEDSFKHFVDKEMNKKLSSMLVERYKFFKKETA